MEQDVISEIRRENLNAYCVKRGWVSQKTPNRGSPSELSRVLGKSSSFWSDLLRNHKKSFGATLAREIEDKLSLPRYSLDGEEELSDFLPIKMLSLEVSAGGGRYASELTEEIGELQFRRTFLRNVGVSQTNAAIIRVIGSSMEPTLHDGAVLLINRSDTEPRQGFIYAFCYGDDLLVKRFFKENGQWKAVSDNPDRVDYPDIPIDGNSSVKLLGRVIWMGIKV